MILFDKKLTFYDIFLTFDDMSANFGIMKAKNRIKVVLAEKEVKVQDLAAGVDASPVTASRWVNNRQQPSLDTLYSIADFLKVDVCDLLVREESE